jgi:hypothetical protein
MGFHLDRTEGRGQNFGDYRAFPLIRAYNALWGLAACKSTKLQGLISYQRSIFRANRGHSRRTIAFLYLFLIGSALY